MNIAMFIIFLVTNLFLCGCFYFALSSSYQYTNGMLLGVHIPKEHLTDDEVVSLKEKSHKTMKRFLKWNTLAGILSCPLLFYSWFLFFMIYALWLVEYCAGVELLLIFHHKKMYALKLKNGWIVENQKKVYIDTALSAKAVRNPFSLGFHIPVLLAEVVCFLPFLGKREEPYFMTLLSIFAGSLLLSVGAYLFHLYINRSECPVYSKDSGLNQKVNHTMKFYKGLGIWLLSLCNGISFVTLALATLHSGTFSVTGFYLYLFLQIFSAAGLLIPLYFGKERKKELLDGDPAPLYVDDDEYWKTGFYYNPGDKHMLVPNRLQSGNYAFNYANKKARACTVFLTVFLIGCTVFTLAALLPLSHVEVKTSFSEETFTVSAGGYKTKVPLADIKNLTLLPKLPQDDFWRTNGAQTDSYSIGHYRGRTYGNCSLYLCGDTMPILMIQTDKTTVFLNLPEDGAIEELYEELKAKSGSGE